MPSIKNSVKSTVNSPLKILHMPFVVAGNPSNLALGERLLGHDSRLFYFERSKFDAVTDQDRYINPSRNPIIQTLIKMTILFYALMTKDIIHYNNGSTLFLPPKLHFPNDTKLKKIFKSIFNCSLGLLHNFDVKVFRFFGKKLYITFQGSDARIHSYHLNQYAISHCHEIGESEIEKIKDNYKKMQFQFLESTMDHIFAVNPDLLQMLPINSSFLPYTSINLNEWHPLNRINKRKKIIHAPTNPVVKGTKYVLETVKKLKDEGFDFDFELIQGMNHEEMKKIISIADLVIDQLLVGWYGGLAVESMALGIPVVAYIRNEDTKFLPDQMIKDCPIINSSPSELLQNLKNFLNMNESELKDLKTHSRNYVEQWHDPVKVAKMTTDYYQCLK